MTIEEVENSIVARLSPLTAPEINIAVRAIPEKESELQKAFEKPTITVQYHSAKTEEEGRKQKITDISAVQQTETIHVQVICQSQKLRGATGIYNMFQVARALLIGFKPTNCRKLFLVNCGFTDREAQVWTFCITLACETISMEKPDDIIQAMIKQISTNDNSTTQGGFIGIPDVPVIEDAAEKNSSTFKINILLDVKGATGFKYDLSKQSDFSTLVSSGLIPYVDVWEFTGLETSTIYYARLRGANDDHESANSNVVAVQTF